MSKIKIMTQNPELREKTEAALETFASAIALILLFTAIAVWCILVK